MHNTHVFSEIFIHLNWHCLKDQPLITPQIEQLLFPELQERCRKTKGVHFVALNGTPTHVHIAFQMEPFVLLSKFVGELKGGSSSAINRNLKRIALQWQRGYGAVSFSKKHTPWIANYIANQKVHHGIEQHAQIAPPMLNETLEIGFGYMEDDYNED